MSLPRTSHEALIDQLGESIGERGTVAAESGYPDAGEWADYFVRARATDEEVLTLFGPRDGRAATG